MLEKKSIFRTSIANFSAGFKVRKFGLVSKHSAIRSLQLNKGRFFILIFFSVQNLLISKNPSGFPEPR